MLLNIPLISLTSTVTHPLLHPWVCLGEVIWFVKSAGKYVPVLHLVLLLVPIVSRTGSSTGQMSTETKEREAAEISLPLSASY